MCPFTCIFSITKAQLVWNIWNFIITLGEKWKVYKFWQKHLFSSCITPCIYLKICTIFEGAGHAEDLVYLWKKFNYDQKDKLVSRRFVKMWANFIKYRWVYSRETKRDKPQLVFFFFSNPTPVIEGLLQNVTWPPVTASQSVNYLRIGDNLTVLDGYRRNFINFWNNLYEKYCKKPFYTY